MMMMKVASVITHHHHCYSASDLNLTGIIDQADEKLFQLVSTNLNHVLFSLLPDKTDQHYWLRARRHDRQLVGNCNKLNIVRCP